jgi:hypothetical protein
LKLHLTAVLLAILCLALSAPAFADIVLFDDGATNGTYNGFFIDGPNPGPFSQSISNGFVATNSGTATALDFGIWVPTGLTPTTVTWWLGTSAFAGDLGTGTVAQVQYSFHNGTGFGYDVYDAHIDGLSGNLMAGNTYWLSLGNANDSGFTQFDAWDVVPGPATCNFAVGGVNQGDCGDGGEAFTLYGTPIPEPGTLAMMGSGLLAAAGILRRRIGL